MVISYDWLQSHIQINKKVEEVADKLTFSGLEVEGIEDFESIKGSLEGIVIGEVITCEKHPGADKLSVTTIDLGEEFPVQIVCGAPNITKGQKVVVATVGAMLYPKGEDPFKIKKSKIRGEASLGMCCGESEIGLGDSNEGIIVLDTDLPNGTPANKYFDVFIDNIIEIGLTPNRADATSHYGVARDIQALYNGLKVKTPSFDIPNPTTNHPINIEVENSEACPRYSGICIDNISVRESPQWLKDRLTSIGLIPKNNVVDITNYILHDLGQPMHAFDRSAISSNTIKVKTLPEGSKFTTLDEIERKLVASDLVICNDNEPMCLAGVFGGLESGVTKSTTSIFLESAYFAPNWVRKTAQTHTLKTDSSFRFERGTDPNMTIYALQKAVNLVLELAGGEVVSEIIDIYPDPIKNFVVEISIDRIQRLIGQKINKEAILTTLRNLEILVSEDRGDELTLSVPPYRVDVQREADIAEEVLRIYGYDNIPLQNKLAATYLAPSVKTDKNEELKVSLSEMLAGAGYFEIITNSLTKPSYIKNLSEFDSDENVVMLNPLSEDLCVMRQTLLFSGLEVISKNIKRQNYNVKLFELGRTYKKISSGKYQENNQLVIFATGNEFEESWNSTRKEINFHTISTLLRDILLKTSIAKYDQEVIVGEVFSQGVLIKDKNHTIIKAGLLQPKILKQVDIKQPVVYAEIDLDYIFKNHTKSLTYKELSKFPAVRRDLSVVVDKKVTFDQIKEVTRKVDKKLIQYIDVFDQYIGENIGDSKKSYSISFILQDQDKTLNEKIIDKIMNKLINSYEQQLDALIRR